MAKLTPTEYDALSSDEKKAYDKAEAEREREEQARESVFFPRCSRDDV